MNRKTVSGIMVTLFLMIMLMLTFNVHPVKADWTWTETIYIRADGSIDPPTAPISSVDNATYTFTDNIVGHVPEYSSAIVVEKDDTVVDGAGYTLQGGGTQFSNGIYLAGRSNVTIKDMTLMAFHCSIPLHTSSNNTISGNNITSNPPSTCIYLSSSSYNTITNNTMTKGSYGIVLWYSSNNALVNNNIVYNGYGIDLYDSSNNAIASNDIANNGYGIFLVVSSDNRFYHNDFVNNYYQVHSITLGYPNSWDDGYPSGGNYWSDYEERYPDAMELDGSGIWDTPYFIDDYNQDNYPLMEPWTPIDELKAEIEELGSEGEIDNQGIVTSLIAKLNVVQKLVEDGKIDQAENILNAFINEVQAQSGKHITPEAADILIESAEYILSHL